ncbi:MAG: retroviral-like aspartic protease family protein [Akkermansia sp.]|nr:retroviral-like aspartic protease family protein [Akkermansia sp.]
MKTYHILAAICMMMSLSPGAETTAPAPPQASTVVDLMKMEQDARCGQVVVTCLVNGQPMRMMLDTGATHTVLHEESVARLRNVRWIDTSRMQFRGNSNQKPKLIQASLRVGPGRAPQHVAMVVNLGAVRSMMAEPIDGIVGMDILGSLPFTFDLRSGKMYWGSPEGATLVPLHGSRDDNGRMMIQVNCEGHSMELLLDTGSSVTRVYRNDWKPGTDREVVAQLGDVDTATRSRVMRGKAADLELAPGIISPQVSPLICPDEDRSMLGMDALQNQILVHLPGKNTFYGSFFLVR